jgi:hypothetical protein
MFYLIRLSSGRIYTFKLHCISKKKAVKQTHWSSYYSYVHNIYDNNLIWSKRVAEETNAIRDNVAHRECKDMKRSCTSNTVPIN